MMWIKMSEWKVKYVYQNKTFNEHNNWLTIYHK